MLSTVPCVGAYAPQFAEYGISQTDFLTFIDGLNECWVACPAIEVVGLAGLVMQQFHGMPIVHQVAAGLRSAATTSIARSSKIYFKVINADLNRSILLDLRLKLVALRIYDG